MSAKPIIVVTNWVHDSALDLLRPHFQVIANQTRNPWPADVFNEVVCRADVLLAFMPDRIDESALQRAPRLRHISCCLKGYDNFDVDACTKRGVLVTILPDHLTEPTSELAIGLMIGAGRHLIEGDDFVRSGNFHGWRPHSYGKSLNGSAVGILGFGAIGQAIAQKLTAFGASTLYWDRRPADRSAEARVKAHYAALPYLLAVSDFVVLALSLDETTRHIINAERLAHMRPETFLINVARGSLVDEVQVARALENNRLGFYAADVFGFEDWTAPGRPDNIPASLLSNSSKTLFTPHLGSAVESVREAMAIKAAENAIQYLQGRTPFGAVNAVTGFRIHA